MNAKKSEAKSFAVYAGDGWYLKRAAGFGGLPLARATSNPDELGYGAYLTVCEVVLDALDVAAAYARSDAVKACHAVRSAGVPAWVVRHPAAASL